MPVLMFASHLHAAGCAVTPEAAVHSAIGQSSPAVLQVADTGYRVQDVQVDAITHRVWIRVSHCGDTSSPLVLVPLQAALVTGGPLPTVHEAEQTALANAPVQVAAVHAGDAVKVFFASQSVQMEMEGRADSQAAVGGMMDVTLKQRGDEPPHRIRGVLRADHRVEVQP